MGFMKGFVGGVAGAASDLALVSMRDKSDREMAEAKALRERALVEYQETKADSRAATQREFLTDERGSKQEFQTTEKDLDRKSSEKVAGMRAKGSGAKPVKIGEDDMGNPIYGVYNPDTQELEPIDIAGSGPANTEPTAAELERARVELSTAGGKDRGNDFIPFNEPSKDQIYARALKNRNGSGGTGAPKVDADNARSSGQVPPAAVADLKRDPSPEAINEFDEAFGPGAAERALGGKTADDYRTYLKEKYPGRSAADIESRVKEKFPGDAKPAAESAETSKPGKGGLIGSVAEGRKEGYFDPDNPLPADLVVSLIESRNKGGKHTGQSLAAFQQAKSLIEKIEHSYSRGTMSRVSTDDLRVAVVSGYLSKHAQSSAEFELASRMNRD
ncbi:MAG: hypothetical protein LC667_01195 [Thioalkalivibrio sp.]|nr:hypothetical protein [Thioalkalivibrio sp.]